jgi:uncharacterized protein (TIGR02996 family)
MLGNDETKILRSMLEYHDEGSRLVLCDWLEERSDPRAPILRGDVKENHDKVPMLRKYSTFKRMLEVRYMGITFCYALFLGRRDGRRVQIRNRSVEVDRENPYLVPWTTDEFGVTRYTAMPERSIPLWLQVAVRYWLHDQWWPCVKEGYILD